MNTVYRGFLCKGMYPVSWPVTWGIALEKGSLIVWPGKKRAASFRASTSEIDGGLLVFFKPADYPRSTEGFIHFGQVGPEGPNDHNLWDELCFDCDHYDCCDCGYRVDGCGCRGCFSCNACDICYAARQ